MDQDNDANTGATSDAKSSDNTLAHHNSNVQKLTKHEQKELRKQQRNLERQQGRETNHAMSTKKKVITYSVIIVAIIVAATLLYLQSGKVKFEDIKLGDHPSIGKIGAKVTVAVFGDYQCPFTKNYWFKIQPKLQDEYGDKLRIVYLPMPTGRHRNDRLSAQAAYCADEQGKWETFTTKLFERQGQADRPTLNAFAPQAGLDPNKFETCMDSDIYKNKVDDDYAYGKSISITVTPTVFVNGIRLAGEYPYEEYKKAVDFVLNGGLNK